MAVDHIGREGETLKGSMQNQPLLLSSLLKHADRFHAKTEIVSRTLEGPIHCYDYREAARRTRKLADALRRHDIIGGDRVATLAWNTYRHFELEHGITGLGAIWHAINPRLIPVQIAHIANHAEDKALFFDASFLPLVEKLAPELPTIRLMVLLADKTEMPVSAALPGLRCNEKFLETATRSFNGLTLTSSRRPHCSIRQVQQAI
jgi:3-(methylthio)propionyl---CoA ligase